MYIQALTWTRKFRRLSSQATKARIEQFPHAPAYFILIIHQLTIVTPFYSFTLVLDTGSRSSVGCALEEGEEVIPDCSYPAFPGATVPGDQRRPRPRTPEGGCYCHTARGRSSHGQRGNREDTKPAESSQMAAASSLGEWQCHSQNEDVRGRWSLIY